MALIAIRKHGARRGQPRGLQGNSYAIVTKELRKHKEKVSIGEIKRQVRRLLKFAYDHKDWTFRVTMIGCGLAGFEPSEIAPLFIGHPRNVKLPTEFKTIIDARLLGDSTRTKVSAKTYLEREFKNCWDLFFSHLPAPLPEQHFHPVRKWRFDFSWPKWKLAVEIHGGSFIRGGHNTAVGQQKDFEKQREAVRLGWRVLPFNTIDLKQMDEVVQFVAEILTDAKETE